MQTKLSKLEIRNEVRRLAPFHHKVELPYNLSTHVPELSRRPLEQSRVDTLVKHAFPPLLEAYGGSLQGNSVLDVACNCGGFTVEAIKLGCDFACGIDITPHYIEQANFIKQALGIEPLKFKLMDIEEVDLSTLGLFDITFCFGILYHFENPIRAMKQLASVTKDCMLIDTTVMAVPAYLRPFFKQPWWLMRFPTVSTTESKDISTSLWRSKERVVEFRPNEVAVIDLLKHLGFSRIEKIKPSQKGLERRYYTGTRISFLAFRS